MNSRRFARSEGFVIGASALLIAVVVNAGWTWIAALAGLEAILVVSAMIARSDAPVSYAEIVFLVTLFAAGRDLSTLEIPLASLRVYVGELALVALLSIWALLRLRGVVGPKVSDPLTLGFLALFFVGCSKALVFGFQLDEYGLRQLVLLAYLGWVPLGFAMAQDSSRLRTALWSMSLASSALVVAGLLRVAAGQVLEQTTTGSHRYLPGYAGIYSVVALAVFLGVPAPSWLAPRGVWRAFGIGSAATGLLLAQHRSAFLAAAIVLILQARLKVTRNKQLFLVASIASIAVVLSAALLASSDLRAAASSLVLQRIGSIADVQDPNIAWRLASTAEIITTLSTQPLGIGFGFRQFAFNASDPYVASHNSYADFALRFGIDGLLVAALLFLAIFIQLRRAARNQTESGKIARTLSAATAAVGFFAAFNVVFHTPYTGPLPWLFLGAGWGHLRSHPTHGDPA
jgi:O-antigen ligase/polysaccharide polymerase Wzy-like membrane protein